MGEEKGMSRREAREAILSLLFSREYTPEKTAEELEGDRVRDFDGREDPYISEALAGVVDNLPEIDVLGRLVALAHLARLAPDPSARLLRDAVPPGDPAPRLA